MRSNNTNTQLESWRTPIRCPGPAVEEQEFQTREDGVGFPISLEVAELATFHVYRGQASISCRVLAYYLSDEGAERTCDAVLEVTVQVTEFSVAMEKQETARHLCRARELAIREQRREVYVYAEVA